MWISRYFVMFILYSVLGWIYETTFCTIKEGKWENRGFLYGPVVPIYGVGATGITMIYDALQLHMQISLTWWQVFLIGYLGSIVLEFGTSWALEKLFHAVWWDYSDMPFNVQGRICLPCSLAFGAAGLLVIYGLYPLMNRIVTPEVSVWKELVSLILMALIATDAALTVSALTGLAKTVENMEYNLNRQMESFVQDIREKGADLESVLAAKREKLTVQHTEFAVHRMGHLQQSALRRVKLFRPTKNQEKQREYLQRVMAQLQNYKKKKRNNSDN